MMIAAFIFVTSLAVILQFAVLSWRAALIRVAAEPLPNGRKSLTLVSAKPLISEGFASITAYGKLCPDFQDGSYLKLRSVRLYYHALELLKNIGHVAWAAGEMSLCTRYAAVMLSNRLERNQTQLAAVRSF